MAGVVIALDHGPFYARHKAEHEAARRAELEQRSWYVYLTPMGFDISDAPPLARITDVYQTVSPDGSRTWVGVSI